MVLDESITPLVDQAWELLGPSDAMDALAAAYQPGRTFAQAFAEFYRKVFAAQGLLVLDAGGRDVSSPGRAGAARGHRARRRAARGAGRNATASLKPPGYHAQVAVGAAIQPALSDRRAAPARGWR